MIKINFKILLSALLMLPMGVLAQVAYKIDGNIKNAGSDAVIAISYRTTHSIVTDSIKPQNGMFVFSGNVDAPVFAKLSLIHSSDDLTKNNPSDFINIFLCDDDVIFINGVDSLKGSVISGSKLNVEYQQYTDYISEADDELDAVSNIWNSLDEKGREKFWFERDQRTRSARVLKKELMLEYADKNPNSYFALSVLTDVSRQNVDYPVVSPLFNKLSEELKNSERGVRLKERIDLAGLSVIGAEAPDFVQNDLDDKPVRLSDYKGKYVLLDFWASWCGPCRVENPNLVKAYERFKDKNFTILGVSLDTGKEAWQKAIEKDGLTWTHVSDLRGWSNEAAKLYSVTGVPASFLIDPDGKIVAKSLTGERLTKFLEEVL